MTASLEMRTEDRSLPEGDETACARVVDDHVPDSVRLSAHALP